METSDGGTRGGGVARGGGEAASGVAGFAGVGVRDRRRVLALERRTVGYTSTRRWRGDRHARGRAAAMEDRAARRRFRESSRKRGSSTARRARRDVRRRRRPGEGRDAREEARVVDEVVDEAVSGVEKAYGALYEVIPGR